MASRRASVATTKSVRELKHSATNEHYQRQASLSLKLEEGRALRPRLIREEDVSESFLDNYFIGQRSNVPATLTRADTAFSPLEEYTDRHEFRVGHPGEQWGERRPTETLNIIPVPGAYQKPFDEPDNTKQNEIEKQLSASKRVGTDNIDPEYAQIRIQRLASDAKRKRSLISRLYRQLLGRPAIKPGAISGLEFVASLPTAHASAVLSHAHDPLDQRRLIYVLEYKHANSTLSSSPPRPFDSVESLRLYLKDSGHASALRLIYTCNNEEAINYLSSDYGISSSCAENSERSFRDWMQADRSSRRAAHKAIKWRPAYDTARKLICSAFAVDFGRVLVSQDAPAIVRPKKTKKTSRARLLESRQRQRIAVYMQRKASSKTPGARTTRFNTGHKSLPEHATCPTIIISEYSSVGVGEIISAAPLLGLDVSGSDTSEVVARAVEDILYHLIERIWRLWDTQIMLLHEPHAELEDYIWSKPADSSRAREVWSMSQRLHTMLKHINRHATLIGGFQEDFRAFAERSEEQSWLEPVLDEFKQLSDTIHVDYVQPLEHMIDLMYKSVTIRDSRQSLELNASLWRLSWITFVFLPLTFLCGFFGMNVDIFHHDPSIKWYFASAVPLLIIVVAFWFSFRKYAPGSKKADYSNAELVDLGAMLREEHFYDTYHRSQHGPVRRSLMWLSGKTVA